MNRRDFIRAASVATLGAARFARAAEARPNFVFFLADDFGWADVGYNGSSFYQTPAIDRLAASGMAFTDAYAACPVCSPTRASILTGKYPARLGITDYIGGHRQGRLIPPPNLDHLPLEEFTFAEALAQAGYRTWSIGKWHLGGEGYLPDRQGFECNLGGTRVGHPSSYFSPYRIATLPDGPPGEYLTDRLTDEAVKRIEQAGGQPFLLYLSHFAVHIPLQARAEVVKKYEARRDLNRLPPGQRYDRRDGRWTRVAQDNPTYAAMIESLDQSLGRVMDALERTGQADNTVIIFMSDNGGLSTAEARPTSNLPLRAGKGWLYEGGIREPMIIRWPGVTRPGARCSVPVTSTDFYPTMLEMAGLPLRPGQHRDGVSLAPVLRGGGLDRDAIFWHYPHYSNQGSTPAAAVRTGDWKLIEFFEDGRTELYNLREDIGETRDLAARDPARADQLKSMLHSWYAQVSARMPSRR